MQINPKLSWEFIDVTQDLKLKVLIGLKLLRSEDEKNDESDYKRLQISSFDGILFHIVVKGLLISLVECLQNYVHKTAVVIMKQRDIAVIL
nr:hypothetical protein [Tanacetum cinerariifolium]